jgi:hypothetical protein
MTLPFILRPRRLPVILPRPEKRWIKRRGVKICVAHNITYFMSTSKRSFFDFDLMLDILQFADLSRTDRYVILALQRRLKFDGKLDFPDLATSGEFIPVEGFEATSVWATISESVVRTRIFTVLDLCRESMALDNPDFLREFIEENQKGCPNADADELLKQFQNFTPRRREEIRPALEKLVRLGILRNLEKIDRLRYRATFNVRLVASTYSGIRQGMIRAEKQWQIQGQSVAFSVDLQNAQEPASNKRATSKGRKKYIRREQYQSMFEALQTKHKAIENKLVKLLSRTNRYEENGFVTTDQLTSLRQVSENPEVPEQLRQAIDRSFNSAHLDPPSEIPANSKKKGKLHA